MSDMLSKNPYIVGPPVTGSSLYGRGETFRFVLETLATPANRLIVLHGQRRVGKTSILQELHLNRLSGAGFYSAYFNPQGVVRAPFAVAVHEMAAAIAETLRLPKPDLTDFEQDENYFLATFLSQALLSLNGRRLVLLIDEFDLLSRENESASEDVETIGVKFLAMVEELITDERWKAVAVILVIGRRIEQLSPSCAQLVKAGHMHRVWLLSRDEARELIVEPARGILEYEPAAIEAILALTADHPYFIQLLCSETFNHARWRRRNVIRSDDVKQVAARALESGATGLAWLWDDLSMAERLIVSAFSEAADETGLVTQASIEATLKKYQVRLGDLDLVQAINHLVEGRVLKHEGEGRYRFEVEMVRRWAKEEHPIYKEKVRIEEISPKAAAFYAAAQHAHRQNRLDVAIDSYKLAMANNPNHRSAQLGLAQALLDKKDLAAAVEAFEEAFAMDSVKAQAGLVTTRLALGEKLESQGQFVQAAVHFRRVLELDPENRRLQEKLRIFYDKGVKAIAARRWRRAVAFLEQVTDVQPDYQGAADRLEDARQQAQGTSSRLVLAVVGGLVALALIGAGISALVPGGLSGLLGMPTATSTQGAVVSASDTSTPTVEVTEGTVEATPTPTTEIAVSTEEATPTPSPSPTLSEILTPSATPTPWVVTATPTPTPLLPSYPAPQLVGPDDGAIFSGKFSNPTLEWSSVGDLGPDDYYIITLEFQETGETTFDGARRKETSWAVEQRLFDRVDASNPDIKWWVVVSRITTDAGGNEVGVEVSPVSETRTFKWGDTGTGVAPTPTSLPTPPPIPLGDMDALDVDINPSNSQEVYAVVKGDGIYKTVDGGYQWRRMIAEETLESLAIARGNPLIIYAAAYNKIFRSENGGEVWQEFPVGANAQVHAIAIVPNDAQTLFAATDKGIFKSGNGGQNWTALIRGAAGQVLDRPFYAIIVVSADGSRVYAAGEGDEIQWSQDAGGSPWDKYVCTACTGRIYALAIAPVDNGRLYAASDFARLGISTDGGGTWTPAIIPAPAVATLKFSALAVDPNNPQTAYAGSGNRNPSDGQGLYRSTDGGFNWAPFNNWTSGGGEGTYVQGIAIDPADSHIIYIAGYGGVYKSTDQGETWEQQ